VFSTIMPVIFLSVAALVLNVLMLRLIDQQRSVIGTLKAVGYGDAQVFLHYLKFGLLVGTGGGLVGCVAGYFMAGFVTSIYKQFYEFPELGNYPYVPIYLGGLAISAACALLGCVHGARAALRLQPADAMRPAPPAAGGRAVWLERVAWLWRRLGFGWRMALRNVIRNRFRTAVGVFAGAMGAALLLTGFMMQQGMHYLIEFQFEKVLTSDVDLSFNDERGLPAVREARQLPGVERAEPVLEVACHFVSGPYRRKGAITGLVADARLTRPRDAVGRPIRAPAAGLAMSRKLAELLHVSLGDRLRVLPVKGHRREFTAPVVHITDSYMGLAVYADIHWLSRQIQEEFAASGVQLATGGAPRGALYRALKRLPAIRSISTRLDALQNLRDTIVKVQGIFIGLLVVFAGVIYFGSVLNASLVSLAERRREVATLVVLGYSPWQIGGLFFRESIVVTLAGTLLGLPLGYGLTLFVAWAYNTEMFRFPVVSPPRVWISTVGLGIAFGLLAHLAVYRQILRLNWLEALQVRE
jgi:putative ABC transport system permease protein